MMAMSDRTAACVLVVFVALGFFAAWQLGIALTLIAIGVDVWWRGRQPRRGRDPAA
jgi:hypothetical protein